MLFRDYSERCILNIHKNKEDRFATSISSQRNDQKDVLDEETNEGKMHFF